MLQDKKKINIVYLFPNTIFRPDLPNFKDRFEMLSEFFEGEIYSWVTDSRYQEYPIGSFVHRGLMDISNEFLRRWQLIMHMVYKARAYHKQKKVDVVVCYDPMFAGMIGSVIKILTGARLIVEINSERYGGALAEFHGDGIFIRIKRFCFQILCLWSFLFADGIKVLMKKTQESIPGIFQKKRIFLFHDFVPTPYFHGVHLSGKEILFVGHPFSLKGVDILIQAFHKIRECYPEYILRLIGHRLRVDAKAFFKGIDQDGRIIFHSGMHYDELRQYFLNCYCFVLPSRTEAMGRALIEAMAAGKPVIGSRVGGIPDVIDDGGNGFLFESENVDDLADKIRKLLENEELRERMGRRSLELVEQKFSSKKYVENFVRMIEKCHG